MRNIIQEFDLKSEVLPILLIGILLNLVGRYICSEWNITLIFGDMVGTAFTSILLGPWWGATVGIMGNAINGNFFSSFFPFGVVNVAGALVWGYLVRFLHIRKFLSGNAHFSVGRIINYTIILALAGGIVCGFSSTITKVALFPPVNGTSFFISDESHYTPIAGIFFSGTMQNITALAIEDLLRDIVDKFITIAFAVLFCYSIRFIPDALNKEFRAPKRVRMKTDSISIFLFLLIYSIYILLAKFHHPTLIFSEQAEVKWLESANVISLLYAPIVLGLFSFLVLSLHPYKGYGRALELNRRYRKVLLDRYFSASDTESFENIRFIETLKRKNIYGLLIAIVMWPIQNQLNIHSSLPVYFGALGILAIVYTIDNWDARVQALRLQDWLDVFDNWLELDKKSHQSSGKILQLLKDVFNQHLSPTTLKDKYFGRFTYICCANVSNKGLLLELKEQEGFNQFLILTTEKPHVLSPEDLTNIEKLVKETTINRLFILTSLPVSSDPFLGRWIKTQREQDTIIYLISWQNIMLAIEQKVNALDPALALIQAKNHTLENLLIDDEQNRSDVLLADNLVKRVLPSLHHLIQRIPSHSTVLDLGAGRGRHTLLALRQGCKTIAVERKKETFQQLKNLAKEEENKNKLTLIEEDYLKLPANQTGFANLVIAAGMLQHSTTQEELEERLAYIRLLAGEPGASVFIEMLFDIQWDGRPPEGRLNINQEDFEATLRKAFPENQFSIKLLYGPNQRVQIFKTVPRSFLPPAQRVDVVSVEYLISENNVIDALG